MIIYNVTINILDEIHDEWLDWMINVHMKAVLKTKCFSDCKMYRVLSPEPDEGTSAYSIDYYAESLDDYEKYQVEHAAALQAEHKERYDGLFSAYRTVMESI